MKDKILGILNIVTKVLLLLVVTAIGAISLATAYIMFAPDDFPKPFHLQYDYSNMTPQAAAEPVFIPTPTVRVYHPGEGNMVNMTTKIINLAEPSGNKYIRLTVTLEFEPDEEAVAAEGEAAAKEEEAATPTVSPFDTYIDARMPILDDTVITLLSPKTYEALYTAEGKEALRQELMQAIAERIPDYKLINVYFTEFVVQ